MHASMVVEKTRRGAQAQSPRYVIFLAGIAAISGFLFGFDTAVINGVLFFLRRQFALDNFQLEIAASSLLLGCLLGAAGASLIGDRLGRRKSLLTPLEQEEFDRDDPWVAGVVPAWIRFDADDVRDPDDPGLEGKVRPCVVIAGSPTHLLVRAGYSEGGVKSRDWKCVPVRYWRQSGFDQPTWIDVVTVRVPRPPTAPTGWMEPDDWNALW